MKAMKTVRKIILCFKGIFGETETPYIYVVFFVSAQTFSIKNSY